MTRQNSVLNNDYEAEQAVLGAVLINGSAIDDVFFLEERDFTIEIHQLIFRVMRYLSSRDIPIDLVTVTTEFNKFNRVQEIGGVSYLSRLESNTPSSSNIVYYARIVKSRAIRHRARDAGEKLMMLANDDEFESDEEFMNAAEGLIDDLRPANTSKMRSFAESKDDYFKHLRSRAAKLKTGWFQQFDDWAQLWRGWLYIVAGRPSVGKTAKALQLAHGIAKNNPKGGVVLIFSQEMDENEVKDRMVSMVAEVNYPKLINKGEPYGFTEGEWRKIQEAYAEVEQLQIFVQDSAGVTIEEIRSTAKQFKKKYGQIAAIIVDYLQIMEIPQRKGEMRTQAIGRVTRTAKTLARRMKFVMIMLSQLDRAVDDEEPKLRHLKESGSIEQDADVVEFLWYNEQNQPENSTTKVIDSIFAKGRSVGTNRFRYEFQWWYQKYKELDKVVGSSERKDPKRNGVRQSARKSGTRS
ncbi:replicative DNA helicase [Paenibacillus aurantiacus]|uniref:DNA 5'-3' helicase n=1 Tax=Paenibacillus aurantiacus TaxID=1936118 RepID=A0ABV5KXU5_9BACL